MRTFLDNHHGPFLFCVTRPHPFKTGFFSSEWLKGSVDSGDVEDEAKALLADPRDTIGLVSVWSEREQTFVGGYRRAKSSR